MCIDNHPRRKLLNSSTPTVRQNEIFKQSTLVLRHISEMCRVNSHGIPTACLGDIGEGRGSFEQSVVEPFDELTLPISRRLLKSRIGLKCHSSPLREIAQGFSELSAITSVPHTQRQDMTDHKIKDVALLPFGIPKIHPCIGHHNEAVVFHTHKARAGFPKREVLADDGFDGTM
jgi:hypothetical protein